MDWCRAGLVLGSTRLKLVVGLDLVRLSSTWYNSVRDCSLNVACCWKKRTDLGPIWHYCEEYSCEEVVRQFRVMSDCCNFHAHLERGIRFLSCLGIDAFVIVRPFSPPDRPLDRWQEFALWHFRLHRRGARLVMAG